MFSTTPRRPIPFAILLVPALLLAACGAASSSDGSEEGPSSERPVRSDAPVQPVPSGSGAPSVGEVPAALLEQILTNAADRADVDLEAIEVLRAEAVTWNDGSLDCPEPDTMYTQALVEGYHVVLEAAGTELDYRATANGDFRLCEGGGRPAGG